MIPGSRVYSRPDQCKRELFACSDIISAAAYLERTMFTRVDGGKMQVRIRNRFTGLYKANNNARDIFTDLVQFLDLKSAGNSLSCSSWGVTSISTYSFSQLSGAIIFSILP